MKFWNAWRHRNNGTFRRLRLSVLGRWYIALTIALGVAALTSRNNILYLIESLLLSGMIFSGVLSERMISAIECTLLRGNAIAGEASRDRIRVRNTKGFPLFCVEIGEWRTGEFTLLAFVPFLDAREERLIPVERGFRARGVHRWDGLAIATSYPFGFARKTRVISAPGERLIWPGRSSLREFHAESRQGPLQGAELSDGEIRPFTYEDDSRMIVWTASAKGSPMVRVRKMNVAAREVKLDLRIAAGELFEKKVRQAAAPFHFETDFAVAPLILVTEQGTRRIEGRRRALDALARVQARGNGATE